MKCYTTIVYRKCTHNYLDWVFYSIFCNVPLGKYKQTTKVNLRMIRCQVPIFNIGWKKTNLNEIFSRIEKAIGRARKGEDNTF